LRLSNTRPMIVDAMNGIAVAVVAVVLVGCGAAAQVSGSAPQLLTGPTPSAAPATPTPSSTSSAAAVWVLITGPADWQNPGYRLNIGPAVFGIIANMGGGVASAPASGLVQVSLVRVADCKLIVSFPSRPGGQWVIRFDATGAATVLDRTTEGLDTGPGIDPGAPADSCPP
jgi:hypothetical protein